MVDKVARKDELTIGEVPRIIYDRFAPTVQGYLKLPNADDTPIIIGGVAINQRAILEDYLRFTALAEQLALEAKNERSAAIAKDLGENTHYIDTDSFSEAIEALANNWLNIVRTGKEVFVYSGKEHKSEAWVGASVLERLSEIIVGLSTEEQSIIRQKIKLFVGGRDKDIVSLVQNVVSSGAEKCRIIVVDDFMVTGISVRNSVGRILDELVKRRVIHEDDYRELIEVNVICGTTRPNTNHFKELVGVPIYAHLLVPESAGRVPHMFGWWKSPDYGFREVIGMDICGQDGVKDAGTKLKPPIAFEMPRPYKGMNGFEYTNKKTNKMWRNVSLGWTIVRSPDE